MAVFCPNCGREISFEGAKFCESCGTPLVIAAAEAVKESVDETIQTMAFPVETAVAEVTEATAETQATVAEAVAEATAETPEAVAEVQESVSETAGEAQEFVAEPIAEAAEPIPETLEETVKETVAEVAPEQPAYVQPEIPAQPVYTQSAQPVYTAPVQQPVYQQPVYQQPVYQQPVTKEPKKKKKKLGFGRRLLAFFLTLLLLVFGIIAILYFSLKSCLTPDNLRDAFAETENLSELEIGKFIGGDVDDDTTLAEYILDQIPAEQKRMYPELTEKNIKKLLDNEEVQEMLTDTFGDVIGYFTGESEDLEIDADKLIDSLKDNEELIEKYTGKKLVKEDFDEIRETVKDINENELADIAEEADDDYRTALKITRFVFSDIGMYIVIGIVALLALLIILACGTFFDSSFMHIGFAGILAGGLYFFGVKFGTDKVIEIIEDDIDENVLELVQNLIFDNLETKGLIVLCAGGALFVLGIIWKIVRKAVSKN